MPIFIMLLIFWNYYGDWTLLCDFVSEQATEREGNDAILIELIFLSSSFGSNADALLCLAN